MDRLGGKVIIVTGGANGMGRAYVKALAREGAQVIIADLDDCAGNELAASLVMAGSEAIALTIDVSEWAEVNLRGTFLCCRAVVPFMKLQRAGKIVNISSSTVFTGGVYAAHHVTSKAGVVGLTKALARELGSFGINVNAIAPGITLSMDDPPEEVIANNAKRVQFRSIKRDQIPDDTVGSMIFLLSSDSDFMTGNTLVVDGGAVMI